MFDFKIGIPSKNSLGNWVKNIGETIWNRSLPVQVYNGVKNLINNIQDKTDENREVKIGGSLPAIKQNETENPFAASKPQESTPQESTPQESTPQESTPQESTPQESEKPLGSSNENLTVSDNANIQKAFDNLKAMQQEQWAREDEIRKHVEEREDSAYQRARADAEKAGINLNLLGINPAQSGGGITNATGADYSMYNKEFESNLDLILQEIEQNFKGTEAEKERFANLIGKVIQLFGLMSLKG